MKSGLWIVIIALCGCLVSGCGAPPITYSPSEDAKKNLNAESQGKLASALEDYFGTPTTPRIPDSLKQVIKSDEAALARGASGYRLRCMHCHGLGGDGNGPTARFLLPLPRDYRRGIFKFTSTDQSSQSPTRDDLMHTLKNGIPGTSMPSFALFEQQEVESILDYVILLSVRGQTEGFVLAEVENGSPINRETVDEQATILARRWTGAEAKIVKPKVPRPEPTAESLERGKQLFLSARAQCTKCHGKEGRGDGLLNDPNADPKDTKDSWGHQARPANLTIGVYRGGGRPIDLFRRIHSGIKGTPMPAQSTSLQDDEIWDVINYVRTLPYTDRPSEPSATDAHGAGG